MNISPAVPANVPPASQTQPRTPAPDKAAPSAAASAPERAPFPHSPDLSELAAQLEPPERARQLALALDGPGLPIAFKLATLRMMLEGPSLAAPAARPAQADLSESNQDRSDAPAPTQPLGPTPVDAEVFTRVDPAFAAHALWASEAKAPTSSEDRAPQDARSGSVPPSASAQALAKVASPPVKGNLDLKG